MVSKSKLRQDTVRILLSSDVQANRWYDKLRKQLLDRGRILKLFETLVASTIH